jgi:membrane-associated protease RseP (regulator of RpoE activity)
MLGGPCMNLLIFLVLFTILMLSLGQPHQSETTQIQTVEKKVRCADPTRAQKDLCPAKAVTAPAFGKLRPGDRVVSVNGRQVTSWDQLVSIIEPSANQPLTIVVNRGGKDVTVHVTPIRTVKYANETGTKTKVAGFLGIGAVQQTTFSRLAITAVPGAIGDEIKLGVDALGKYPEKIQSLWRTVFEGQKRDPQGAIGVVGIGRISGDYARSSLYTTQDKTYILVNLLAGVNLLLFFFNLLPLLPLDGGHVAGALVEATKRGWARLRARRNPEVIGPDGVPVPRERKPIFVDTAAMLPVMYGVASVLILLTLLTLYADIVKPINPNGG